MRGGTHGTLQPQEASSTREVIDLREPEPATPPRSGDRRCRAPSCSGRGYLDHIDPFKEIMYLHCTECYAKYDIARAQMESRALSVLTASAGSP